MVVIMQNTQEKADLQKMKVNTTKIRKVGVDGNKFRTGKNGGQMSSSLGCRLIVVGGQVGGWAGRQADDMITVNKFF